MAVSQSARLIEPVGGVARPLVITNKEIERFEDLHPNTGVFELWDQLSRQGRRAPLVGHVRDMVTLAMIGGGMNDLAADALMASLGPEHNEQLRALAFRALGVALFPDALVRDVKKNDQESPSERSEPVIYRGDTTSGPE